MKKLIFLMLLIPALCWGQATIGKFRSKKGGVVKHPAYTTYYEPWGAVNTHWIGEVMFDTSGVTPALNDNAQAYWYAIFFAKLDWSPPLEVWLNGGAVTGNFPGGSSAVCQEQAQAIIDILARDPYGEVIDSDGEIVYQLPYGQ